MKKRYDINLIIKKKPDPQQAVIYFLLNYFKHILVITQIVIIGVFMYRLKLDIEISDYTDTYYSNREFVKVAQPMMEDLRQKAWLSAKIAEELEKDELINQQIDYLMQIFPQDFTLLLLSIEHEILRMEGNSIDYRTIMRFYNRLKKDKRFQEIKLANVEKTDSYFRFAFELRNFTLGNN